MNGPDFNSKALRFGGKNQTKANLGTDETQIVQQKSRSDEVGSDNGGHLFEEDQSA